MRSITPGARCGACWRRTTIHRFTICGQGPGRGGRLWGFLAALFLGGLFADRWLPRSMCLGGGWAACGWRRGGVVCRLCAFVCLLWPRSAHVQLVDGLGRAVRYALLRLFEQTQASGAGGALCHHDRGRALYALLWRAVGRRPERAVAVVGAVGACLVGEEPVWRQAERWRGSSLRPRSGAFIWPGCPR